MADHLAQIYGTEKDRVNCPFYYKIGACRHGDRCQRQHNKPPFSQTVLLPHLWQNPRLALVNVPKPPGYDEREEERKFDDFYEDIFTELAKYGHVEELAICGNLCDHLVGNIYVMYSDEEGAARCVVGVSGRFYSGRPILAELSPVTDFREARCRQFEEGKCLREGMCNFMHLQLPSRSLQRRLFHDQPHPAPKDDSGSDQDNNRDRSRSRDREKERDRYRDRDSDRRQGDSRDRRSSRYEEDRYRSSRYEEDRYRSSHRYRESDEDRYSRHRSHRSRSPRGRDERRERDGDDRRSRRRDRSPSEERRPSSRKRSPSPTKEEEKGPHPASPSRPPTTTTAVSPPQVEKKRPLSRSPSPRKSHSPSPGAKKGRSDARSESRSRSRSRSHGRSSSPGNDNGK